MEFLLLDGLGISLHGGADESLVGKHNVAFRYRNRKIEKRSFFVEILSSIGHVKKGIKIS